MDRNSSTQRSLWLYAVCVTLLLGVRWQGVVAQTEIYRCQQLDGTVAFQGQPCEEAPSAKPRDAGTEDDSPVEQMVETRVETRAETEATVSSDDVFASPFDEPVPAPAPRPANTANPPSEDRARCEKRTRDAIDAIDAEIRRESSADQRNQYLPRLRELTAELRACKLL